MVNSISSTNLLNAIKSSVNVLPKQAPNVVSNVDVKPQASDVQSQIFNKGQELITGKEKLKQLDGIFAKIKGKNGVDFANVAYAELVKFMDLDGLAPSKITWEKHEGRNDIVGDFRFYNNSVVFYSDYFLKLDKASQIGIIAHELTHCKQLINMLKTDGLPVEKIAYAYAISDLKAMLITNPQVIKMHNKAKQNGKEKEFMQYMISLGTQKTTKELKESYANILAMPKHPLNSENGKKAQADWVAQFNYNGADYKAYNDCALEKEAMLIENLIKAAYKTSNI